MRLLGTYCVLRCTASQEHTRRSRRFCIGKSRLPAASSRERHREREKTRRGKKRSERVEWTNSRSIGEFIRPEWRAEGGTGVSGLCRVHVCANRRGGQRSPYGGLSSIHRSTPEIARTCSAVASRDRRRIFGKRRDGTRELLLVLYLSPSPLFRVLKERASRRRGEE